MPRKILHAADIHLDSPLRGLERYPGAPAEELRSATRDAFENLVETALREKADAVLIAGDLYDGSWKDHRTGLHLAHCLRRLDGIPTVLVRGNHDAENAMTNLLRLPPQVSLLAADRPQSLELPGLDIVVHGQSYGRKDVRGNLAAQFPAAGRHGFHIGLLHTALDGREGHDSYAPCALDDLRGKGYGYWALGHVHQAETLDADRGCPIVFPGNLQGRHARETGPKGAMWLEIDDAGRVALQPVELAVLRWEQQTLPADGWRTLDDLWADWDAAVRRLAADGRLCAVRVRAVGPCPIHAKLAADPDRLAMELRALAGEAGAGRVWVEKVKWDTRPSAPAAREEGPMAEIDLLLDELRRDGADLWPRLLEPLAQLRRKLPPDLVDGDDDLAFHTREGLAPWLDGVRELLLEKLRPNAS